MLFVSSPCADRTPLTGSNNGGTFLAIELDNKHLQPHRFALSGYLSAAKLRATLRIDLAEQTDLGRIGRRVRKQ